MQQSSLYLILVSGVAAAVLFLIHYRNFGKLYKTSSQDSITSFFELRNLLSTKMYIFARVVIGLTVAGCFFFLCTSSPHFREILQNLIINRLDISANKDIFDGIPEYLSPLIVIIGGSVFYTPLIHRLFYRISRIVLLVARFQEQADEAVIDTALELIRRHGDARKAEDYLEATWSLDALPLPEELVDQTEKSRLAYKVLFLAVNEGKTMKYGLKTAIQIIATPPLEPMNQPQPLPTKDLLLVLATAITFATACTIYTMVVPKLSVPMSLLLTPLATDNFKILWPTDEITILESTLAFTLTVLIPLSVGTKFYSQRRNSLPPVHKESLLQSFGIVFALQVSYAIACAYIFTANAVWNDTTGHADLTQFKYLAQNMAIALAAPFGLAAAIYCKSRRFSHKWCYILISLTVGGVWMLKDLCFQLTKDTPGMDSYFLHEILLGLYLMAAYLLSIMFMHDTSLTDIGTPSDTSPLLDGTSQNPRLSNPQDNPKSAIEPN